MGEPRRLLGHPRGNPRGGVAHGDDGDPGPEVDQGVAVGVHDHAAARVRDEHRQDVADPAGHRALAPRQQLPRDGSGDLGNKLPALRKPGAIARNMLGHDPTIDHQARRPKRR
jgi:hypothetical protein